VLSRNQLHILSATQLLEEETSISDEEELDFFPFFFQTYFEATTILVKHNRQAISKIIHTKSASKISCKKNNIIQRRLLRPAI
jgi:hypothetical protein